MRSEVIRPGAKFLICQEPVEAMAYQKGVSDRAEQPTRVLLFSVDIEPNFFLPIWNRHISFSRGDNNGLAG